jgi:hypothetical protein
MLEYVQTFADYWRQEKGDKWLYEGLLAKNKDRHLETVTALCNQYSVARSLPLKFDMKNMKRKRHCQVKLRKKYELGIFAKPSVAVKKFIDSRNLD